MAGKPVKIRDSHICWTVCEDYADYVKIFSNPPASLPKTIAGRHAHPIYTIPGTGEKLVIKQSHRGGLISNFNKKLYLDRNRAVNEMKLARYALDKSVPTAEIIAAGCKSVLPGIYNLYVVSRMIERALPLPDFLRTSGNKDGRGRRQAIEAVTEALFNMHNAGIFHCDLNANNILIDAHEKGFDVYLIDFDKSYIADKLSLPLRMKNLYRLERSMRKLGFETGQELNFSELYLRKKLP